MKKVTRYEREYDNDGVPFLVTSEHGDWVRYYAYEKLKTKIDYERMFFFCIAFWLVSWSLYCQYH